MNYLKRLIFTFILLGIFLATVTGDCWGESKDTYESRNHVLAYLTITGDPLKIEMDEYGNLKVYRLQGDPASYVKQYFSLFSTGLFLNGAESSSRYGSSYPFNTQLFTPVSGEHNKPDSWTIRTVNQLGSTGVRITQTIYYTNGNNYYKKVWLVVNDGESTYNDVRLMHGGDTYFAGDDSSEGHWENTLGMIYLTNPDPEVSGIMGMFGSLANRASHYYEDNFTSVWTTMATGSLPDTIDAVFQDAGYALQWNKNSLAPGDAWEITCYEKWTEAGFVQVFAPAGEVVLPGTEVTYNFIVTNLQEDEDTFDLTLNSENGWTCNLPDGDTVTIAAASGEQVTCTVTVPEDAADLTTDDLTLTATSQADEEVTNSDVTTTRVSTDEDGDGVVTLVEQGGDGSDQDYDGNDDGIPDYTQGNVSSLYTHDGQNYVTLVTENSYQFKNVVSVENPSASDAPADREFSCQFFSFEIDGLLSGAGTCVTMLLPNEFEPDCYYVYGKTESDNSDHWYEFNYNDQVGAEFSGSTVTIHFVDGEEGDGDLAANGEITNVGGPAISSGSPGNPDNPGNPGNPSNNPPSAPNLVYPGNSGAINSDVVPFTWKRSTDPDGDSISYHLYYGKNADLSDAKVVDVADRGRDDRKNGYVYGGFAFMLMGAIIIGRKKGILSQFLILLLFASIFVFSSCEAGIGDHEVSRDDTVITYIAKDLDSNTVYYWKVVCDDGKGGTASSETWNFNTF